MVVLALVGDREAHRHPVQEALGAEVVADREHELLRLDAKRARQIGFLNAALGLAFAVGPIVAGLLIATVGWRAVFSVRAPLAVVALVAALRGLPRDGAGVLRGTVRARDIFRRPVFHLGALPFLAFGGNFAIWLLAPFYIVERRGLSPPVLAKSGPMYAPVWPS